MVLVSFFIDRLGRALNPGQESAVTHLEGLEAERALDIMGTVSLMLSMTIE